QAFVALGVLASMITGCSGARAPLATDSQTFSPQEISFIVSGIPAGGDSATPVFAEYGIQFSLTGTFKVGPAPNGQVHNQALSTQELEKLQESWGAWLKSGFNATETCISTEAQPELSKVPARIAVNMKDREKALVRIDGGQICGPADKAVLEAFSSTLLALAKNHYPKTFPSECLAATDALEEAHQKVQECDSDSECANVDSQYFAIPAGQIQYVALKSCSVVPHLSAGNVSLLQSEHKELIKAREYAKTSCAPENRELVCTAEADVGFQNHRYPARCVAAKCAPGKTLR
ncbi:hypothetical protein EBZ37_07675, partial [bacterium]|nr:hypothetical protein [bacterium]